MSKLLNFFPILFRDKFNLWELVALNLPFIKKIFKKKRISVFFQQCSNAEKGNENSNSLQKIIQNKNIFGRRILTKSYMMKRIRNPSLSNSFDLYSLNKNKRNSDISTNKNYSFISNSKSNHLLDILSESRNSFPLNYFNLNNK